MTGDDELLGGEALETEENKAPASGGDEQSSETEAAEVEAGEEEGETSDETGETEGDEEQETETGEDDESELEEVEYQGKKYKLHPDLKPALMMHADYTRKTQAVAERERTVDEREQSLSQQVETHKALIGEIAQLTALDQQIAQYQNVDWGRLDQEDPWGSQQHFRNLQQLKDKRQQIAAEIQKKEQERSHAAQRDDAKRAEEYAGALQREIPGWNNQLDVELSNFARSQGYSDQELISNRDVRAVKILKLAMDGIQLKEKLQQKQKAAKTKPKGVVKPLEKPAKGRAPARTGLTDDIPIDDWVKQRQKQVAAKSRY